MATATDQVTVGQFTATSTMRMRCGRVAGGEVIDMDLKLEAALDTRDALAKSIYAALFRCSRLTSGGAWHGRHSDCHSDRLRVIMGNVLPVTAT